MSFSFSESIFFALNSLSYSDNYELNKCKIKQITAIHPSLIPLDLSDDDFDYFALAQHPCKQFFRLMIAAFPIVVVPVDDTSIPDSSSQYYVVGGFQTWSYARANLDIENQSVPILIIHQFGKNVPIQVALFYLLYAPLQFPIDKQKYVLIWYRFFQFDKQTLAETLPFLATQKAVADLLQVDPVQVSNWIKKARSGT